MNYTRVAILLGVCVFIISAIVIAWKLIANSARKQKNYERALKMVPMLIHLPPSTDDIQAGGRDDRDVTSEEVSEAQVMYSIIASTFKKGFKNKMYGQSHISFEIVAHEGLIKYYVIVPGALKEVVRQAITAAYPTARLEEVDDPNFFSKEGGINAVAGGELHLKEQFIYPIATYEDTRRDASRGLINALSNAKKGDGVGVQIIFRPTDGGWTQKSLSRVQNIKDGKKSRKNSGMLNKAVNNTGRLVGDLAKALWEPPEAKDKKNPEDKILTNLQQEEIQKIEDKTKYPGFEVLIRIVSSSALKARSEAVLSSVVSVFSQFDLTGYNGFKYDAILRPEDLARNYILRMFPQERQDLVLNSVEMASIFHLPSQKSIPTSQVERQMIKQVDGPAKLAEEGVILGVNKFRGEEKVIRLTTNDRRRHTYVIGSTGMGKSILLTNIAYQDMMDGRGFAFIDPHGDAVDLLLSKVPPERKEDVILFEPGNLDNPVGMNMFEFNSEDQKDFIVQEGINMLTSLYDPGNQGIFGPRAQHMFRNAALLLMSDPDGGTFIDIPRCFIDPEFVKSKLKYVTDQTVYDYWTKEFPASQKSSDAGEVTSWFVSKWGPFLSNKMMRNILGQTKSGFNIRDVMDNKKILLVNLSKGTTGELNAKLLGMIFVMKFQAAAMSRADTPEDERQDFCLFVDEFQNFATESFESILSEARKYRLNLVLANQFMTQLTDKIREAILGNVGTIMSGRLGVTDAELMEKAFSPVFTAEDLHKQPNYHAITTVMMFNMPTSPFTLSLLPSMGDGDENLMHSMRKYSLAKYGRPRAEVEAEIDKRLGVDTEESNSAESKPESMPNTVGPAPAVPSAATVAPATAKPKKNFLDAWLEKKNQLEKKAKEEAKQTTAVEPVKPAAGSTVMSTNIATLPKPITAPVSQKTAVAEMDENPNGSVWAATAAKNAEAKAAIERANAAAPSGADKAAISAPKPIAQKPVTMAPRPIQTTSAPIRVAPAPAPQQPIAPKEGIQPDGSLSIHHDRTAPRVAPSKPQNVNIPTSTPNTSQAASQAPTKAKEDDDPTILRLR